MSNEIFTHNILSFLYQLPHFSAVYNNKQFMTLNTVVLKQL